ncbi:MAG: hypothetical protein ACKVOU_06630 [Cytophagales bacterium]
MLRFEVIIDENIADNFPEKTLMALKGVVEVNRQTQTSLSDDDWVRPGRPATTFEMEQSVIEAENSTFQVPISEARTITQKRFESKWK